jgi:flagellar motor switch protein FliG
MDISVEFGELIGSLENDSLKGIIKKVDTTIFAKSLKTVAPEISEKVFTNLNENEAGELRKKISGLGTIRLEEVEKAQKEIIGIITKNK